MTSPLLIESVTKSFFLNEHVLNNVSLSLKEDEIFGLIGLNGIGKTTLIKIILDLLSEDSGKIKIFGKNKNDCASRAKICYLPEKFQPSFYLRGIEFLEISMSFFKKKLDIKRAKELAEQVNLDVDALDLTVEQYSKGMGQKLGLLSCFLSEAPLLILDEPMSGLDPRSRIKLKEMLIDYKKKGRAVFFSSHILADIDEICDHISILHDSKIKFNGTPEHCKKQYSKSTLEHAFLNCIGDE